MSPENIVVYKERMCPQLESYEITTHRLAKLNRTFIASVGGGVGGASGQTFAHPPLQAQSVGVFSALLTLTAPKTQSYLQYLSLPCTCFLQCFRLGPLRRWGNSTQSFEPQHEQELGRVTILLQELSEKMYHIIIIIIHLS